MHDCPKCGMGTMHGPTYCSGCINLSGWNQSGEHLHYRCDSCGYKNARSTEFEQRELAERDELRAEVDRLRERGSVTYGLGIEQENIELRQEVERLRATAGRKQSTS